MKIWIMAGIMLGMLLIAGIAIAFSGLVSADNDSITNTNKESTISCSSCGNTCSIERNCGLGSCGAVSGGSCGCGKKEDN